MGTRILNKIQAAFLLVIIALLFSCGQERDSFKTPVYEVLQENKITNIGRSSWQKPNAVINKLGNIEGKTIVDIGAGTGYFTFRMAFKAAKVIATDIDTNMVALIDEFTQNLPVDIQGKIETRLVKEDDPMIRPGECDIAVIINTFAYIENQVSYLRKLASAMNKGSKIMIVDFKSGSFGAVPRGTNVISANKVVHALEAAGFKQIVIDNTTLEYQYIILADIGEM
ncbi:MAG: methyltransferase domain-containing protein [Saprospiraceae bacterium]|nr:methyltransferase domain-containing protein [Saprospiraceae bacterium]